MSELLKTTTAENNHESAFITDAETNEREINVENIEASYQLAANILKLVESDDSKSTGDYFTEVIDNKIETSDDERDAIFDFLSNQQRIALTKNILFKQDEVIAKLDYQSEKTNDPISDAGNNFLRKINITGQDMEENVVSRLRATDNSSLALRGYEPVLADVKSTVNDLDTFNNHVVNSNRWKNETIQNFKLNFDGGPDKKHIEALDAVSSEDNKNRELSSFIDQDVVQKSVEKLRSAVAEAKDSGKSPEEALLGVLNEKPKESPADLINSVSSFIKNIENHTDLNSGDLANITRNTEQIRSLLTSFDKKASELLQDNRIHPEVALDINRILRANLDTATQLSLKLRQDLDRYFAEESNLLHKEKNSKTQTPKASLFK